MSIRIKNKKISILLVCLLGLFDSFLIGLMLYLLILIILIMTYPFIMFFMGCVIIIMMLFLIMEFTENVISLLKRFGLLEKKIKPEIKKEGELIEKEN